MTARPLPLRIQRETKLQLIVAAELEGRNQNLFGVLSRIAFKQRNEQLPRRAALIFGAQAI